MLGELGGLPDLRMQHLERRRGGLREAVAVSGAGIIERVSRRAPCTVPGCGRQKFCGRVLRPDGSVLALCTKVAEGSVRTARNGAYVHVVTQAEQTSWRPRSYRIEPPQPMPDWTAPVERWAKETPADDLRRLARRLGGGITIEALRELRTFSLRDLPAQTIAEELGLPVARLRYLDQFGGEDTFGTGMHDHRDRVGGVSIRWRSGRKGSIRGSRLGLFVPSNLDTSQTVHCVEGASDSAVLLSAGLQVVGRPGCDLGGDLLTKRLKGCPRLVVWGEQDAKPDGDWPGRRGALRIARQLALHVPVLHVAFPPAGMKDVRAWCRAGASAEDIEAQAEQGFRIEPRLT